MEWSVAVSAPPDADNDFNFAEVNSPGMGRGSRPFLYAYGTIATDQPEAVVVPYPHDDYTLPASGTTQRTHYYELEPGMLIVTPRENDIVMSRFDRSNPNPVWTRTLRSNFVEDATKEAELANGDQLLLVTTPSRFELVTLHVNDGSTSPIAAFSQDVVSPWQTSHRNHARVAVAEHANLFLAMLFGRGECSGCIRVEVRKLDSGALVRSFEFPRYIDDYYIPIWDKGRTVHGNSTLGFDGRYLWGYNFKTYYSDDVLGWHIPQSCGYAVYDTEKNGAVVRTLEDATGVWASLNKSCEEPGSKNPCCVRGLLPTANGGAIAFAVEDRKRAKVVKFDGAP